MHVDDVFVKEEIVAMLKFGRNRWSKLLEAGLKPKHVLDPDGRGAKLELFRLGDVFALVEK